jgi:N-6 DNA Methylase
VGRATIATTAAADGSPAGGAAAVRIEGSLLPADLLARIAAANDPRTVRDLGLTAADYGLPSGENVRDAAARAWNYLSGRWRAFAQIAEAERTVAVTRRNWLLPLFQELGFGATLQAERTHLVIDGRSYPVSHTWRHVPIHLLRWDTPLDARAGRGEGPASAAPQAMLQDYLNRSSEALWGVLSNGATLRLLRDSTALVGASYIEFDLEAIFAGEAYSDFVLLFLMAHWSRFTPTVEDADEADAADEAPDEAVLHPGSDADADELVTVADADGATPQTGAATCWLERWRQYAFETGTQAREQLRDGVSKALVTLGNGFLNATGEANARLREALFAGQLNKEEFHHGLLRLVYRLLFLFVAEDRGALHPDDVSAEAVQRYADYYSTARLRRIATRRAGDHHGDLWQSLVLVFETLGGGQEEQGDEERQLRVKRASQLLGLPRLGGLFERTGFDRADGLELANHDLLDAVRSLDTVRDATGRSRTVDYRNLGSDELGSVFESLLEEIPSIDRTALGSAGFGLERSAGNQRKTSGSFYTPTSVIECLLDSALEPVIDDALAKARSEGRNPEEALLDVTVCDPACGSGHFLTAAARRIAKRLAALRTGDEEPIPVKVRQAMHDVVRRCVHGVDINPLAVELTKIALWLEALEPGRPLTFLDAQIKVGNGLLGATPKLLLGGIPDAAFNAIEGDQPEAARMLKKRNREQRRESADPKFRTGLYQRATGVGTIQLDLAGAQTQSNHALAEKVRGVLTGPVRKLSDVARQRQQYREYREAEQLRHARRVADTWCAAFVQEKRIGREHITNEQFYAVEAHPDGLVPELRAMVDGLADQSEYGFFHWHLEFPHIFRYDGYLDEDCDPDTGWKGGFSVVVGNPPWDKIELNQPEFFASRDPHIARAPNKALRDRLIEELPETEAGQRLYAEFLATKRRTAADATFLKNSGRYPTAGAGRLNTYAVFAETAKHAIAPRGRFGLVLPTGIATDKTTSKYFGSLTTTNRLASFYEFENEAFLLSRAVHHSVRFCLLTAVGRGAYVEQAQFAAGVRHVSDVKERTYQMSPADIGLVNPNTSTLPVFRTQRDAEITLDIYRRVPVLLREAVCDENDEIATPEVNPWGLSFTQGTHNMATDSHLFRGRHHPLEDEWELKGNVYIHPDGRRYLPLYEAKMLHHYDHRFGTYEGQTEKQANVGTLPRVTPGQHDNPDFVPMPRYWAPEFDLPKPPEQRKGSRDNASWPGVAKRLSEQAWSSGWLLAWRDIARTTDSRTSIAALLPYSAIGHTSPIALLRRRDHAACFAAILSSYTFDFVTRQKIAGTHLTYSYVKQLPMPTPTAFDAPCPFQADIPLADWLNPRVLELVYTSHDMAPFARDLGDDGPPFRWNEERRELLRAEIDAAMFHVYGVNHEDADYIMGTFPTVREREEKTHGYFRSKKLILELFDLMREAAFSSSPYRTSLTAPPGFGERHPGR